MNARSKEIIRAAAYIECAGILDMRAKRYRNRGKASRHIADDIEQEANHLRDRAVEIRSAADKMSADSVSNYRGS